MSGNDYDRGVNTFDPQGRLHQVEYAMEAMKLGHSAIGIAVKEGIVLIVERKLGSKLMVPKSSEKIAEIDSHMFCAVSGFIPDQKTLLEFARVEAQQHKFVYNEPMSVLGLTTKVSDLMMNFGDGDFTTDRKPFARPFGVGLLIAGVDKNGPALYQTDPSGTMVQYHAKGIGAAHEGIQNVLQERYKNDLSLVEAEKLGVSALKDVMEDKINKENCELCVIPTSTKKFEQRSPEYIENIIKNIR